MSREILSSFTSPAAAMHSIDKIHAEYKKIFKKNLTIDLLFSTHSKTADAPKTVYSYVAKGMNKSMVSFEKYEVVITCDGTHAQVTETQWVKDFWAKNPVNDLVK